MTNLTNDTAKRDISIEEVRLEDIVIKDRMREVDENVIDDLCESIEINGLMHAITINKENVLISGYHRYTAHQRLEKETILCNVIDVSNEDEIALMEIDENLLRVELHYIDLADQIAKRQEIYERLYPETKAGATGKGRTKETLSFVDNLQKKINKGKSSIYSLISMGKKVDTKMRQFIKDYNLSQSETTKLLNMKESEQDNLKNCIVTNNISFKQAIQVLEKKEKEELVTKTIFPTVKDFTNSVQVNNFEDVISKIPSNVKYDVVLANVNLYTDDTNEQLKAINIILESIDDIIHADSILYFPSNEIIDHKLEGILIDKFEHCQRIFTQNEYYTSKIDSTYNSEYKTVYVCRNSLEKIFDKTINNIEHSFFKESVIINEVNRLSHKERKDIYVFEPFINSLDSFKQSKTYRFNYFGICHSKEKYALMDKEIDLTKYFSIDNIKQLNQVDMYKKSKIVISKSNIYYFSSPSILIHIEVEDEFNHDFTPIEISQSTINEIFEFVSKNNEKDYDLTYFDSNLYLESEQTKRRIYGVGETETEYSTFNNLKDFDFEETEILNFRDSTSDIKLNIEERDVTIYLKDVIDIKDEVYNYRVKSIKEDEYVVFQLKVKNNEKVSFLVKGYFD